MYLNVNDCGLKLTHDWSCRQQFEVSAFEGFQVEINQQG